MKNIPRERNVEPRARHTAGTELGHLLVYSRLSRKYSTRNTEGADRTVSCQPEPNLTDIVHKLDLRIGAELRRFLLSSALLGVVHLQQVLCRGACPGVIDSEGLHGDSIFHEAVSGHERAYPFDAQTTGEARRDMFVGERPCNEGKERQGGSVRT